MDFSSESMAAIWFRHKCFEIVKSIRRCDPTIPYRKMRDMKESQCLVGDNCQFSGIRLAKTFLG